MSAWKITELKNETCSKCGQEYSVKYESLPLKDADEFICSCGEVLRSWRETGMYVYSTINNENKSR